MRDENISQKEIDQNFKEVIQILSSNNINYWLCHGTLLGIIRDNELIAWDHDIDIAVWQKKNIKEEIFKIMRDNKFILKEKYFIDDDLLTFTKNGGREIDINFYEKKLNENNEQIAFIKWYVPKNNLMRIVDAISIANYYNGKFSFLIKRLSLFQNFFKKIKKFLIKKNLFHKCLGYTQPLKLLKNFKKIYFKNLIVTIPSLSEEYLEYVYGSNWKKPIKKYNWIKDSPSTKDLI